MASVYSSLSNTYTWKRHSLKFYTTKIYGVNWLSYYVTLCKNHLYTLLTKEILDPWLHDAVVCSSNIQNTAGYFLRVKFLTNCPNSFARMLSTSDTVLFISWLLHILQHVYSYPAFSSVNNFS